MKGNVKVLGISTDPVDSHKKFCDSLKLPFPLLADEGAKVSKLYGILITTPKGDLLSGRSVFLVDKEGLVTHADAKYELKPAADHDALIDAVKKLSGKGEGKEPAKDKPKSASAPKIEGLEFGGVTVNGKEYTTDVVIARGTVRERDKGPSKGERARYGHTPLTVKEEIPWDCKTLLIGIGMSGQLPVTDELKKEAEKRGVKLILLETPKAVEYLREHHEEDMNVILHVTC